MKVNYDKLYAAERADDINEMEMKLRECLKSMYEEIKVKMKEKNDNEELLSHIGKILNLYILENDIYVVKVFREQTYELIA